MEFVKEENRIYIQNEEGKVMAEITFNKIKEGLYNIDHTYVDEILRGQKIGQKLVEMAIDEIKNKNAKVEASCSYAKKYIDTHKM